MGATEQSVATGERYQRVCGGKGEGTKRLGAKEFPKSSVVSGQVSEKF